MARTTSSRKAWNVLATTYAKPSRGRIKHVKNQLKNLTKGTLSITYFVYSVKARSDELAVLDAPMDTEDLTERILNGLDDDYKELVRAVQARDDAISFDELHEKLLSFEASLQTQSRSSILRHVTANPMTRTFNNNNWRPSKNNWRPSFSSMRNNYRPSSNTNFRPAMPNTNQARNSRPPARPYLGHCQICGTQGHTAKRCPSFHLVPVQGSNNANSSYDMTPSWHPQANFTSPTPSTNAP